MFRWTCLCDDIFPFKTIELRAECVSSEWQAEFWAPDSSSGNSRNQISVNIPLVAKSPHGFIMKFLLKMHKFFDGLMQNYSNSTANALELLQSCTCHLHVAENIIYLEALNNALECPTHLYFIFNSMWPSDTIWRHRSVNTGSGNGLLPDGTKPLPQPMLTYHQRGSVAFSWEQFHRKCSRYQFVKWVWNYNFLKIISTFPRDQWVNSMCPRSVSWHQRSPSSMYIQMPKDLTPNDVTWHLRSCK